MQGFLNLNKPSGLTSHDCVARIRRSLHLKRVGHGGTLDPAATGVLPIALGRATRLLQFLPSNKAYRATIRFGIRTTTDDLEGEILSKTSVPWLTLEQVQQHLSQFVGKIQQIPPRYSAIQVGGRRLYDLARAGETVEVPIRTVEIYRIEVLGWRSLNFPEVEVAIVCGTGTYIRSIARDLGEALNVGGTLASLIRTDSSGFQLKDSLTLETVSEQIESACFQLIPPETALHHLTVLMISPESAKRWGQGQRLTFSESLAATKQNMDALADFSETEAGQSFYRVHQEDGKFLGIGQLRPFDLEIQLVPKLVWE